jgi:hypothetical protein
MPHGLRRLRMSASAVIWWMITSGAASCTAAITASRSSPSTTTGSAQLRDLAGHPRGGGDLVTRRNQPGNEVPSQCPGRSHDEDSHDLSFRVVLSLADKAPPGAVTVFNLFFVPAPFQGGLSTVRHRRSMPRLPAGGISQPHGFVSLDRCGCRLTGLMTAGCPASWQNTGVLLLPGCGICRWASAITIGN